MAEVLKIPLSKIVWKSPIREEISREDVENMSTSFMVHGQIHPIVVTPPDENGMHEGICGRLRYLGARRRGLSTILARVRKFESEEEKVEWQLVENVHRREVPYIDKCHALAKLKELIAKRIERETGHKPSEKTVHTTIAEEIEKAAGEKKVSAETILHHLRIHKKLPEAVKKVVRADNLGRKHCTQLLRVKDPTLQLWLAEEAGRAKPEKWGYRKLRQVVSKLEKVTETVKNALVSREIALGHVNQLARLYAHQQDKVLGSVKRQGFAPKTTKLLVDLVLEKPEEIDRLTSLTAFELEAEKEKARVAKTPEELEEAWKLEEAEKFQPIHTYKCPGCGRELTIKIDWFNGIVEWKS